MSSDVSTRGLITLLVPDQRYTVHIEANHPGTDFLRSEGQYYSHLSCAMYIDGVYRNNPVQCFGKAKNWITPIVVDIAHARVSRGEVAAMIFGRPVSTCDTWLPLGASIAIGSYAEAMLYPADGTEDRRARRSDYS